MDTLGSWPGTKATEELTVVQDGDYSNIKVPAGTYNICYNTTTGKITIELME